MPLVKSRNNKPILLSSEFNHKNHQLSYVLSEEELLSIKLSRLKSVLPSSSTTGNIQNPLMNLGDDLNNSTTSINIRNLGSSLRNAGDRFNQQ